jgi:carboxypeptidase Taq
MQQKEKALDRLGELDREILHVEHAIAALDWDQQTYMPAPSAPERSEQLAILESVAHKRNTSPEIGELLAVLGVDETHPQGSVDLSEREQTFVREINRRYSKLVKLPESLVIAFARERSLAQAAWVKAKEADRFSDFAPNLEKVVKLARETAECFGYEDHIYDALLDIYEPGMKSAEIANVFSKLADNLSPLVAAIAGSKQVRSDFLQREYPAGAQEQMGREILKDIGFDFERGRLDVSAHPFTTSLGPHDIRLTTNYDPTYLPKSIFGSIHEGGHGMYEQGVAENLHGTILGEPVSLGIHESQSRSWENVVGRSLPFWKHYYPRMCELFPTQLKDVSLNDFYAGINRVEPSFVRIEADEVTYNLHIILRFELEMAMLSGELNVRDLPGAWNDRMKKLLGITPPSDAVGVLQDIHWSAGLFGYFPTYALGNLYGAQFAVRIKDAVPDLDERIENGDFAPILEWHRRNIHAFGSCYSARELCVKATGGALDPDHFMTYLNGKFMEIYAL